jgi:hypothetical protein
VVIAEQTTVLVVAAHPDDEVLGAGGTIARHADAGDVVQVLIVAEGATSRQRQRDRQEVANDLSSLAMAAQAAGRILGAAAVELLSLPDNRLDSLDRLDLISCDEGVLLFSVYKPSMEVNILDIQVGSAYALSSLLVSLAQYASHHKCQSIKLNATPDSDIVSMLENDCGIDSESFKFIEKPLIVRSFCKETRLNSREISRSLSFLDNDSY